MCNLLPHSCASCTSRLVWTGLPMTSHKGKGIPMVSGFMDFRNLDLDHDRPWQLSISPRTTHLWPCLTPQQWILGQTLGSLNAESCSIGTYSQYTPEHLPQSPGPLGLLDSAYIAYQAIFLGQCFPIMCHCWGLLNGGNHQTPKNGCSVLMGHGPCLTSSHEILWYFQNPVIFDSEIS